jgi:hypothetical protein
MQNTSELLDHRKDNALAAYPLFSYNALKKHRHLLKHESSLLIQICTGKVRLCAFLFERKVLEVAIPRCSYSEAPETAAHLVLNCLQLEHYRENLRQLLYPISLHTYCNFAAATAKGKSASKLVRWLLSTGRFPEFRLAKRYRAKEARKVH